MDEQIFIFQRMGGVGRYFTHLAAGLDEELLNEGLQVNFRRAFAFGRNSYARDRGLIQGIASGPPPPSLIYVECSMAL